MDSVVDQHAQERLKLLDVQLAGTILVRRLCDDRVTLRSRQCVRTR